LDVANHAPVSFKYNKIKKNPQRATRQLTVDREFERLIQTSGALFGVQRERVAQILNLIK
jgi:hypothetical protein